MNQARSEMDEAVEAWLDAHHAHERYVAATESLFEVFARSWQGSRRCLSEAFADFRSALLQDSASKRLKVTEVSPRQRTQSE